MTDPPRVSHFDVTPSQPVDKDLTSPAIFLSPSSPRQASTTNQNFGGNDLPSANTAFVTNPSAEVESASFQYHSDKPSDFHVAKSGEQSNTSSTHAGTLTSGVPALGNFGSQTWITPFGPYLDFAPQPIYQPIGELALEQIELFPDFDSPSSVRSSSTSIPTPGANVRSGASPQGFVQANIISSGSAFVQPSLPKSALKRRADSDLGTSPDPSGSKRIQSLESGGTKPRSVSFERMSGPHPRSPGDGSLSSDVPGSQRTSTGGSFATSRRGRQPTSSGPRGAVNIPSALSQAQTRSSRATQPPSANPPLILPPEKVFPIQIGSDLFRLSGASISSDAPSYFTQFFEEQLRQNEESGGVRTLYIDRDPATFRDVARHLQGYHVKPVDGSHFVKLFADAQFYSLPRLIAQLFESEIFIQIGEKHFEIPKDIFSDPGNSPNFFSLGFAVFFSSPSEVFPGLDRRGLLRPPSIVPPSVPGRSAEIFAQLLHLLRGYPLQIRDENHRAELLRDCRYFHLRGVEQKVIAHEITYNPERRKTEICIRLEDVKPSGVSFVKEDQSDNDSGPLGWVYYARPFVDDTSYELVVEIGGDSTILDLNDMRADFHGLTKARVTSLFQVVANKMNLPINAPLGLMMLSGGQASQSASPGLTPLSEDLVKVRIDHATDIRLDGEPYRIDWSGALGQKMLHGSRQNQSDDDLDSDEMSDSSSSSKAPSDAGAQQPQRQRQQRQIPPSSSSNPRSHVASPPRARPPTGPPSTKKRKLQGNPTTENPDPEDESQEDFGEWIIRKGQWRLRVQPLMHENSRGGLELVFLAVKIDAFSGERARNSRRSFLGS